MRFLQPAVDDAAAWKALHKVRFALTRRFVRRCFARVGVVARNDESRSRPQRELGKVPYLELIWLPHYLVTFQTVLKGRVRGVEVIVGGNEPTAIVIDLTEARWEVDAQRAQFSASLGEQDAVRVARRAMLNLLLRAPGWGAKPAISEASSVELVQYPLWVYYFARRRDILDVKTLDAVTGRPAGSKAKLALLEALAAAHKPS